MDPMMLGVLLIIVVVAVYYFAVIRPKNAELPVQSVPIAPITPITPIAPVIVETPIDVSTPTNTSEPPVTPSVVPMVCDIGLYNDFLKINILNNNKAFDATNVGGCAGHISYAWKGADLNKPYEVFRDGITINVATPQDAYNLLVKDSNNRSIIDSGGQPTASATVCDLNAYKKYMEKILLKIPFDETNIAGCLGSVKFEIIDLPMIALKQYNLTVNGVLRIFADEKSAYDAMMNLILIADLGGVKY